MTGRFPNARIRLRSRLILPHVADTTADTVLWLDGDRFHLRDETGRPYGVLAARAADPAGIGPLPRTIEAIMDARTPAAAPAPTDIWADLGTGDGLVIEPWGEPWPAPAADLAPLAARVLAAEETRGLTPAGTAVFAGRRCDEYTTRRDSRASEPPWPCRVRILTGGPYVLLHEAAGYENDSPSVRTEIVDLAEGEAEVIFPR